jgi:hypothetical protein
MYGYHVAILYSAKILHNKCRIFLQDLLPSVDKSAVPETTSELNTNPVPVPADYFAGKHFPESVLLQLYVSQKCRQQTEKKYTEPSLQQHC